ncbi:copper resistance CopC family protein [Isoptericola aurantiacus]|uniref:copper resistance CopC family protein n=1 Tax=Isoptericola aurantiacus TaxID=3377839 RepID=UPI00383A9705
MAQNPAGRTPASSGPGGSGPDDGWTPVVRKNRRRVVAIVVALAMLLTVVGGTAVSILGAVSASAHDQLVSSDPADGAALDEPVGTLTLTFSSEVIADGTQVRVTGPDGASEAQVTVDGEVVTASFEPAGAGGAYDVAWRAVSADGHPIEGQVGWTVAEQPGADATEPGAAASEPGDAASAEADLEDSGELDGLGAVAPEPSASTTGPATGTDDGLGSMPLVYGAALVVMIGVAVALLTRSRRRLYESHGTAPPGRPTD